MERRVLVAIFLCFLFLYVWQMLVVKPVPKPAQTASTEVSSTLKNQPATPGVNGPQTGSEPATASSQQTLPTATPATSPAPLPTAAPLIGEASEREVRVETRDVIAVFTNRGARLKSWRLKHYLDRAQQPQELVVSLDSQPLPFTMRVANEQDTALLNSGLFAVSGAPDSPVTTPIHLRFE